MRLDYFKANRMINDWISQKKFNLLETVAEEITNLLLESFAIHSVEVSVTKFPIDMPNASSVSYVCRRTK